MSINLKLIAAVLSLLLPCVSAVAAPTPADSLPGLHTETVDNAADILGTEVGDNDSPFDHAGSDVADTSATAAEALADAHSISQTLAALQSPLERYRISSEYGWRIKPLVKSSYGKRHTTRRRHIEPRKPAQQFHTGIDMAAPHGSAVHAAYDGTIIAIGNKRGYGDYLRIRHENGVETAYAHMSSFAKNLKAGQTVRTGDVIGFVGSTGRSTGPHVHYEVLVEGFCVDPQNRLIAKTL